MIPTPPLARCGNTLDEPHVWIPDELRESLLRYAEHRIPTGGFLFSVLANDLFEACGRADEYNAKLLTNICCFVYNTLPANCWGSREKVAAWLNAGREPDAQ